jgi:hypothetical protein
MSYLYKCIKNELYKLASKAGAAKVNRTPDPVITNDGLMLQNKHFHHFVTRIKSRVCAVLQISQGNNLYNGINNSFLLWAVNPGDFISIERPRNKNPFTRLLVRLKILRAYKTIHYVVISKDQNGYTLKERK